MTEQAIINHIDTILAKSNARNAFEARIDQFAEERSFTLGPNDKTNNVKYLKP